MLTKFVNGRHPCGAGRTAFGAPTGVALFVSAGLSLGNFVFGLGVLAALLGMSVPLHAQSEVALATRTTRLQALARALHTRDANDRRQARAWAAGAGIPVKKELPKSKRLELQRLVPGVGPIFYVTNNLNAADTVSTDNLWPGGTVGLALDGSGMTLGEWDGGAIAEHPDLLPRLTQRDGATDVSDHSTHVAGTLVGSGEGLIPTHGLAARGMAYNALLDAYDWNSDTAEMAAAAADSLLLSNHSYGVAAGWISIGGPPPDNWWWIGGESSDEDPNFGYYDSETQLWDQIAFDAPYYLIVKAAGNDRWDIGPEPGEEYTIIAQDGTPITTSTEPRPADCSLEGGYDCLPTNSVAKNILTVGAVDDLLGGYSPFAGPLQVQMAGFSGWGPTDDGRIKPDLVGNGVLLLSTVSFYPYYAEALGTSMAAPNVTGSLLLLQEHYEQMHGTDEFMRAATLKALAIHTADEAGDAPGPDYRFGWGLLNTETAAEVISEDGSGLHQIIEGSLAPGATDTVQMTVNESGTTLKATLVWTDPPGTPVPPALDPPDSMLVNDLDLRISDGIHSYRPWVLDPASPAAPATRGDNIRDNVEQVVISGAEAGTYSIHVSHKGTLLDGQSQPYSIIISVQPSLPSSSGLVIDEDFSSGQLPTGWSVETASGVDWEIKTPVTGDSRLDNLTGGDGPFAMVDNNYSYMTVTSLRTPVVDLSSAVGARLIFKSYYYYDFLESLNVDASADGGITWTNMWRWQGFNPSPAEYVVDLSGLAAGQADFMVRFRFDSEDFIDGDLWQIDDIQLEALGGGTPPPPGEDLPEQASNPNPADGSTGLGVETDLAWSAGSLADSHDVYFGTSNTLDAGQFQGNQTGTTFDPGTLEQATTYYWRIDEVNGAGVAQGDTWSFTTEDLATGTVYLANLNGSVVPAARGRWLAAVEATVHDQDGNPEADVTVDGTWSAGANGTASCITDGSGRCSVEKGDLKKQVTSVTFTVDSLSKSGMSYEASANLVSSSIVVGEATTDQTPTAADDSYSTTVGTPVSGNVLDNDDPGDLPATVALQAPPDRGTLSLDADGGFLYTPEALFEGNDSLTYSITDADGDLSNTATVTIEVTAAVSCDDYLDKRSCNAQPSCLWNNRNKVCVDN